MEERIIQSIRQLEIVLEKNTKLRVLCSGEVEFYLRDSDGCAPSDSQLSFFKALLAKEYGFFLEKEKGSHQYEVALQEVNYPIIFIQQVESLRESIIKSANAVCLNVYFKPKPFFNDYGNSLHVHIHIEEGQINKYSFNEINSNEYLQYTISGILSLLEAVPQLVIQKEEELKRLMPGWMAPTKLSWGGNNRTTVIRVPDSPPENRRIEFRLPSADCDIEKIMLFLLLGVHYGIKEREMPPLRIYGNASDSQYALKSLIGLYKDRVVDNNLALSALSIVGENSLKQFLNTVPRVLGSPQYI